MENPDSWTAPCAVHNANTRRRPRWAAARHENQAESGESGRTARMGRRPVRMRAGNGRVDHGHRVQGDQDHPMPLRRPGQNQAIDMDTAIRTVSAAMADVGRRRVARRVVGRRQGRTGRRLAMVSMHRHTLRRRMPRIDVRTRVRHHRHQRLQHDGQQRDPDGPRRHYAAKGGTVHREWVRQSDGRRAATATLHLSPIDDPRANADPWRALEPTPLRTGKRRGHTRTLC